MNRVYLISSTSDEEVRLWDKFRSEAEKKGLEAKIVNHLVSCASEEVAAELGACLAHGKVAYGEQRDLFCSAAEGLQGMFRPPSAGGDAVGSSRDGRSPSNSEGKFPDSLAPVSSYAGGDA